MQTILRVSTRCDIVYSVLCLAFLANPDSNAQQLAMARIDGTVTDPSGKSVADIIVTLTNVKQGTARTFTTGRDGAFAFATIEAAAYELSASASAGFGGWRESIN